MCIVRVAFYKLNATHPTPQIIQTNSPNSINPVITTHMA